MIMVMVVTKRDDQVLQLGKEEREKQKPRRSRQRYQIGFCFGTQDTIKGVSVFRIDSHTMKRGEIIVDAVIKCH